MYRFGAKPCADGYGELSNQLSVSGVWIVYLRECLTQQKFDGQADKMWKIKSSERIKIPQTAFEPFDPRDTVVAIVYGLSPKNQAIVD